MAVSAKFVADVSSFVTAMDRAQLELRNFDKEIGRIDKDLARFGDQFSGRKLIQDVSLMTKAIDDIGGTSKLTQKELEFVSARAKDATEKMRAMGVDVPPKMQALADAVKKPSGAMEGLIGFAKTAGAAIAASFTVGAVIGAIRSTGEWAGRIDDLSKKMGISREAVQRFDFAAKQNGSTVDAIGSAMAQLGKRLVEGDTSTVGALNRLGLSLDDLRGKSPDQVFKRIAGAINELPDPMEKSAAAMALMGRSGADLIPMFSTLEQDMGRAVVASDAMIAAGDRLGDAWDALKSTGTGLMAGVLVPMTPALESAARMAGAYAQEQLDLAEATRRVSVELEKQQGKGRLTNFDQFNPQVQQELFLLSMERAAKKAEGSVTSLATNGFTPLSLSMEEADRISRKLDARTNKQIATNQKAIEKQKALEKAAADALAASRDLERGSDAVAAGFAKEVLLVGQTTAALNDLTVASFAATRAQLETVNALERGSAAVISGIVPAVGSVRSVAEEIGTLPQHVNLFSDSLQSIAPSIVSAFQGGGDVVKSAGAAFGSSLTSSIFGSKEMKASIIDNFGKNLGGAFNAILPGIGALAGPLISGIGKLFKKIAGGPSEEELGGRYFATMFRAQIAEVVTEAERLEIIENVAKGADLAWASFAVNLKTQFTELGESGEAALQWVDKLWRAEKEGPEAVKRVIDEINTKIGDMKAGLEDTDATLSKYGLDFNKQSEGILHDWDKLNAAGFSQQTILKSMDGPIQAYVDKMHAAGMEIPDSMQAIVDSWMAVTGSTVTATGAVNAYSAAVARANKLALGRAGSADDTGGQGALENEWTPGDDLYDFVRNNGLSDLTRFAENYEEGSDARNKAANEAANWLNDTHTIEGVTASGAEFVAAAQQQARDAGNAEMQEQRELGFATGTGGKYLNFGSGTPVTLHGRERVMTESEGAAEASGLAELAAQFGEVIAGQRRMLDELPRAIQAAVAQAM